MRRLELQGGCYVTHCEQLEPEQPDDWSLAPVVDAQHGSRYLSQQLLQLPGGATPVWSAGGSDVVLFILDGAGDVNVSHRAFGVCAGAAVHVRPGEAFCLHSGEGLRALISVCPEVSLRVLDQMPDGFDETWPDRAVSTDEVQREEASGRHFRLLLGKHNGSERVSLFVGSVPQSKAPEHYHLYEEVLCVLSGQGRMWAGTTSAPVRPGSLMFLPREQPHCLECTDVAGIEVLGVFYPAGSPAVSYDTDET